MAQVLRQPEQWGNAALAAIGGYAAALALWEITHLPALAGFVFGNDLHLSARRNLALLLLAGIALGLILWVVVGFVLARSGRASQTSEVSGQPKVGTTSEVSLSRAARIVFLATPLAFLPVLAIPNLEDTAPFFALACLGGAIATLALAVMMLSHRNAACSRQRRHPGCQHPERSSGHLLGRNAVQGQPQVGPDARSGSTRPPPSTAHQGDRKARPSAQDTPQTPPLRAFAPSREPSPSTTYGPESGQSSAQDASPASRRGWVLALVLALAYALFMSWLTVARHNSFLTNAFDLGIHDQAIYNILHSGYMRSTLYGTYAIDYIGDHFSPILFLLAPLYALRQDARTLLILQSLFLAAGAVPLYQLARLKTRSVWLALALVATYLLHPALHGVNLDDFHQIALVAVFLLAALYFLETGRDAPFLISLALALIVKEEVALTVAAIGAYALLGKGRRLLGAAVALAGLAYFAIVIGWVMPRLGGTPQIDTRFGDYIAPETSGATGVAWTLFTNPWFTVVHVFGNQAKLLYLLQIFLPVLFLPLLAPGAAWLVALPALAVLLLTNAHTQYNIAYHYSAHLLPSVFFLAVLALGRIVRNRPATGRGLAAALLISGLGTSYLYGEILPKGGLQFPRPTSHDQVVAGFFDEIPGDAVVSTMSAYAPHLTTRKDIYLFPDVADSEYLLLDTGMHVNYWPHEGLKARDRSLAGMLPHFNSGEFGVVREEDGVILLRRGHDTAGNAQAVAVMFSPVLEAEDLRSDFDGSVVSDGAASGGKVRVVTPAQRLEDGRSGLVYGPYLDLQPGVYRATFVMKVVGSRPEERVVKIDVFTHKDGYPRVEQEIRGVDFAQAGVYQAFAVEFNTSGQVLEDVEVRVFYDFNADLSVDRVELEYLGQ